MGQRCYIDPAQTVYLGNDINDAARLVLNAPGGQCALRELTNLYLTTSRGLESAALI